MKDERNIGKLGSEKRSLNDEVGLQGGDTDAPKAQMREITLTPGDSWLLQVFGRRYGGRPAEGGEASSQLGLDFGPGFQTPAAGRRMTESVLCDA